MPDCADLFTCQGSTSQAQLATGMPDCADLFICQGSVLGASPLERQSSLGPSLASAPFSSATFAHVHGLPAKTSVIVVQIYHASCATPIYHTQHQMRQHVYPYPWYTTPCVGHPYASQSGTHMPHTTPKASTHICQILIVSLLLSCRHVGHSATWPT